MPPRPLPDAPKPLPHPAEDLSEDDDLLSWVLVDQLGCLPNTKLGVHPQQVKFVGPVFKTEEVLNIIRDTVIIGNTPAAVQRLQEFHLIKKHLDGKETESQRERFLQHLRRYLLPLQPQSRIDMHVTARYTAVTGHVELGVFATRPLSHGVVLTELQGSVVPLPDEWRAEMDLSDEFALRTTGEEVGSDDEDDEQERQASRKEKGKSREVEEDGPRGHRRSKRTGRRDFSIVWSGLKNCFQLFLGPARFLNHDCSPNVELLRQGKYVTFRVTKPIKIGEELTTFYGDDYFGKGNRECLCLTCEINHRGGFTPKESLSRSHSRDMSAGPSSVRSTPTRSGRTNGHSSLRNVFTNGGSVNGNASDDDADASQIDAQETGDMASVAESSNTPLRNPRPPSIATPSIRDTDTAASDDDDPDSPEASRRGPSARLAAKNFVPGYFARPRRGKKASESEEPASERMPGVTEYPSDYPRCVTCCKPLEEQIWFNNKYFDHCSRCIRHALIFGLPWPAHKPTEVQEFPPAHLVPPGYLPKKVSSVPLPSLDKNRKKEPEIILPPQTETREERYARKLAHLWAQEDFTVESMREEEWIAQETKEINAAAALQAKLEAKAAKEEEKRKREENKIKGSGVWSKYEYVTEEEIARRIAERTTVVTSGKRRSGIYRRDPQEEVKEVQASTSLQASTSAQATTSVPATSSAVAAASVEAAVPDDVAFSVPSAPTAVDQRPQKQSTPSTSSIQPLSEVGEAREVATRHDGDDAALPPLARKPNEKKRRVIVIEDSPEPVIDDSSDAQTVDTPRYVSNAPAQTTRPVAYKMTKPMQPLRVSPGRKWPLPRSGRPGPLSTDAATAPSSSTGTAKVHIPTSARPSTVSASTPFSFKPIRPMPPARPAPIVITAAARPVQSSPKPSSGQEPVETASPGIPSYLSRFRGMGSLSKPSVNTEPKQAQHSSFSTNAATGPGTKTATPSSPAQMASGRNGTISLSKDPSLTVRPSSTPSTNSGGGFASWNGRPHVSLGGGTVTWDARNGRLTPISASNNALTQSSSPRGLPQKSAFAEAPLRSYIPAVPSGSTRPAPAATFSTTLPTIPTRNGSESSPASSTQSTAREGSPRKRGRPPGSGWRQKAEAKRLEAERSMRDAGGATEQTKMSEPTQQPAPKPSDSASRLTPVKNGHWSPPKASSPVNASPKLNLPNSLLRGFGDVPSGFGIIRLSSFRPALNGVRVSHWSPTPSKSPDDASPSGSEPNSSGSGSGTGHDSGDSASAAIPSDGERQPAKTTPVKALAATLSGGKWHSPTANRVVALAGNGIMVGGKRVRFTAESSSSEPDPKRHRPWNPEPIPYRAPTVRP